MFFQLSLQEWLSRYIKKHCGTDLEGWSIVFGCTYWLLWEWQNKSSLQDHFWLSGGRVACVFCKVILAAVSTENAISHSKVRLLLNPGG